MLIRSLTMAGRVDRTDFSFLFDLKTLCPSTLPLFSLGLCHISVLRLVHVRTVVFFLRWGSQVCHEKTASTVTSFITSNKCSIYFKAHLPQSHHHQTFISVCPSVLFGPSVVGQCYRVTPPETEGWHERISEQHCKTWFHGVTPFLNHNTLLFYFFL